MPRPLRERIRESCMHRSGGNSGRKTEKDFSSFPTIAVQDLLIELHDSTLHAGATGARFMRFSGPVRSIGREERGGKIHMSDYAKQMFDQVVARTPGQPEFHQAVQEVFESLTPVMERHPEYKKAAILERISEPERVILFRVTWVDDRGDIQVNKGYR